MNRGYKGANVNLTQAELKEVLRYEPRTGKFFWAKSMPPRGRVGQEAGWVAPYATGKRIKIAIRGTEFPAHRLAWLYMTGEWPKQEIDHRDGDGTNNRWANLREATSSENLRNCPAPRTNTTGHKGTCFDKKTGKFIAGLRVNGRRMNLGSFETHEEAIRAYRAAARKHHGEFAKW